MVTICGAEGDTGTLMVCVNGDDVLGPSVALPAYAAVIVCDPAVSVDSDAAVRARLDAVAEKRERGEPTVPTTIGEERATNPFLRAPQLAMAADASAPYEAFARVRAAKDGFKG